MTPDDKIEEWASEGERRARENDIDARATGGFGDDPNPIEPLSELDLAAMSGIQPHPKPFVIPRLAPAGEVTLFTGPGSAGKSLLGQQFATALAAGVSTLSFDLIQAPAIYLTCEDDAEQLHWRQMHICESLRVPMQDLAGPLHLISLRGALDNHLGTFAQNGTLTPSPAFHRLVATIKASGAKMAILDNVAHLFTGNENDRGDVTRFINLLNRLAGETGAAIILIGHPPKPSRPTDISHDFSGSTAWLNAVRSQFKIDHDKVDGKIVNFDLRVLTVGKANYARKGDEVRFYWKDWAFVLEDEIPADIGKETADIIRANGDIKIFLNCLAERTRQRRAVSESRSPTFAPAIFAAMPESKSIGKVRLEKAMDALFRTDRIERAELWKGSDRKPVFGLRKTAGNGAGNTVRSTQATVSEPAENGAGNAPNTHTYTYGNKGAAFEAAAPHDLEHATEGGDADG